MFSKQMVIAIGGVILIVCSIIFLSLSSKHPTATNSVEGAPVTLISPFQKMATGTMQFVRDIWHQYFWLASTAQENKALRKALKRAVDENFKCSETELSNQRLRKFLNFQKSRIDQVLAAEVIAKDPSPWFHAVIIDKGEDDGIVQGLPVVNSEGIIGQVMAATSDYAKVLLMIDRNSAVDSLVQRSRARGITRGNATDQCRLQYVLRKNDVKVGDTVISSGLDGVFPKGLRIGHVSRIIRRNAGIFQDVEVTPFVDFEKLEEVLVVLNAETEEPAEP